jgi:hypothetical protein
MGATFTIARWMGADGCHVHHCTTARLRSRHPELVRGAEGPRANVVVVINITDANNGAMVNVAPIHTHPINDLLSGHDFPLPFSMVHTTTPLASDRISNAG